jgi:hypothetical protein
MCNMAQAFSTTVPELTYIYMAQAFSTRVPELTYIYGAGLQYYGAGAAEGAHRAHHEERY